MAIIDTKALKRYLNLGYNVLFEGEAGVGKTAIIKQTFEDAGLRWKYFSASTLDPWVDFVGVPKVVDRDGKAPILDLIRPELIQDDAVDAIFFDELNRAPDKVLNAVMELIQFKSINGHKLQNLRVIWGAINPEDDEGTYSVTHLDKAQRDRFQVQMKIPFKVDDEYFEKKYPSCGKIFINWWNNIPEELRKDVSPRRLDYAADAHMNLCRLEDFLPKKSGIKALRDALVKTPFIDQLKAIKTPAAAETFLKDVNNITKMLELVKLVNPVANQFLLDHAHTLPQEILAPFKSYLNARTGGFEAITSVLELIDALPNGEADVTHGDIINNVDFRGIYKKSKMTLEQEIKDLNDNNIGKLNKLSNRISDILIRNQTSTLIRLLWGIEGVKGNKPTNLNTLAVVLAKQGQFSARQKTTINNLLFSRKIVSSANWLTA
jgi:hypothetical protein